MPSLSELPSDIKRNKLTKALVRLGFVIDEKGGNGSHYKAIWPSTQKAVTLQYNMNKYTLLYVLKEIETISGMSWNDIKEEM